MLQIKLLGLLGSVVRWGTPLPRWPVRQLSHLSIGHARTHTHAHTLLHTHTHTHGLPDPVCPGRRREAREVGRRSPWSPQKAAPTPESHARLPAALGV